MDMHEDNSPLGDLDLHCYKDKVFDGLDSTYDIIRSLIACAIICYFIIAVVN